MMKHLMVLQTCDDPTQAKEGFVDRQGNWINAFTNVRCNVQESNLRKTLNNRYAKQENLNEDWIYFIRTDVYNELQDTVNVRAIVWRANFAKKFTDTELNLLKDNANKDLFNIYKMNNIVNITEGQVGTKKRVYILRCERTTKMDL